MTLSMQKLAILILGVCSLWTSAAPGLNFTSSAHPPSPSPTPFTVPSPFFEEAAQCLGDRIGAKQQVIYLHGMDTPSLSPLEIRNRKILTELAGEMNLRIALPRSPLPCPTKPGSVCWGWDFGTQELANALAIIAHARRKCFPERAPTTLIGFSNGGYLLTHWYRKGLLPAPDSLPLSLVAFGSELGALPPRSNLRGLPRLTLAIGNRDEFNRDSKHHFFQELKSAGARVDLIEFDGGHALDKETLRKILSLP